LFLFSKYFPVAFGKEILQQYNNGSSEYEY